jgi:hypothetical protein
LIFTRYHLVDSVRYLIQHNAGSGKSLPIAWLAHQLLVLYDDKDQRRFDAKIVVTDRRILRNFFAILGDEAHASQAGEPARHLHSVLSTGNLEQAEKPDGEEPITSEDHIYEEIQKRGRLPNVSYFASIAIHIGRVKKVYPLIRRPIQGCKRFTIIHRTPKTTLARIPIRTANTFHTVLPNARYAIPASKIREMAARLSVLESVLVQALNISRQVQCPKHLKFY